MLSLLAGISSLLIFILPVHSPVFFPKLLPSYTVLAVVNTISSLLIFILSVHSPVFFPKHLQSYTVLAVVKSVNTSSCVGLKKKIGHPAHRNRQLVQVPVLSAGGI